MDGALNKDDQISLARVKQRKKRNGSVVALVLPVIFQPRTTGDMLVLLDEPGPKVDPPLRIQAEYSPGEKDLETLKKELEGVLREKLIFRADVELVPEETLPRFEMKAKLIRKLYEGE